MSRFDLEAEVRDLAARRDIYDVVCRYMRGQDRLLPDVQLSAFWPDADVDCGLYRGNGAGFTEFAQGFLGGIEGAQHLMGQVQIHVHGMVADGEVYFVAWHRVLEESGPKDLFVSGRYIDRYECRGGEWRIARRKLLVDWARTEDAADGFVRENYEKILHGGRREGDFSVRRDWGE